MMHRLLFCFLLVVLATSCRQKTDLQKYRLTQGETMGTYYRVTYQAAKDYREDFDRLLKEINADINTYDSSSAISAFNTSTISMDIDDYARKQGRAKGAIHFWPNWEVSGAVAKKTNYAYDPTVLPLVNYWGFGSLGDRLTTAADTTEIERILPLIGWEGIKKKGSVLTKNQAGIALDFSSCAKGYAVDILANFLLDQGVKNLLVDIGGEARAHGINNKGKTWVLGINEPGEDAAFNNVLQAFPLKDQAIATSGNYRNFYKVDDMVYSHTINTSTGFPERNNLLSATIFAPTCLEADAYATACMTLGTDKCLSLIQTVEHVEAYLIFGGQSTAYEYAHTDGIPTPIE